MEQAVQARCVLWSDEGSTDQSDWLAREEPLEIRVNGAPVAVLMRTPGQDEELVRGFLLTEQIVTGVEQIERVRRCRSAESETGESNVMRVVLRPEVEFNLARFRRNLYASSSCGLCGRASIEAAMSTASPLLSGREIQPHRVPEWLASMRAAQMGFEKTGALHAAAVFAPDGRLLVVREDIGRHNAVDKVIGYIAMVGSEIGAMVVSGRVSFEIVQKGLAGRIPVIVGVSAPSSLAVELAVASGMGLIGFARGRRMTIYSSANMGSEFDHE